MSFEHEMGSFFLEKGDPETNQYVDKNLRITQQIFKYMHDRGWTQKDLAKAMNKSEAEISKWLSGVHNMTLKSLTKLETVLGEDIITTPMVARSQYEKVHFVKVNVYASVNTPVYSGDYIELTKTRPVKLQVLKAS